MDLLFSNRVVPYSTGDNILASLGPPIMTGRARGSLDLIRNSYDLINDTRLEKR